MSRPNSWKGLLWIETALMFALMNRGNRNKRRATLEPFAVKPDAVRLPDGQVIARQRIYRFGIRNTEDGQVLFYGGNTIQRAGQVGAAIILRNRTSKVRVDLPCENILIWSSSAW